VAAAKPALLDEADCWARGERLVGVDEVGRGALAGPLVAAAVSLPAWADAPWLAEVRDSKLLSRKQITRLAAAIRDCAPPVDIGIGWVGSDDVDRLGIEASVQLAFHKAIRQLFLSFGTVIFDGNMGLYIDGVASLTRIKGDRSVATISVASIIAKEYRDRWMRHDAHDMWPAYGFDSHVGYGVPQHLAALQEHGPSPIHRRSFAPVKDMVA
jgi:ribonuclease HII